MKERFLIIISLLLIFGALVGLNAASYAPTETAPDDEARPNRSTFNAGATGARAFYDFLRETDKLVSRWQEKPSALLAKNKNQPKTFVIIGEPPREFAKKDVDDLLMWTAQGGRLVIISRRPKSELLPISGGWQPEIVRVNQAEIAGDPTNASEMTKDVVAAKPVQPSVLTSSVNAILPSKFATVVNFKQTVTTVETQTTQTVTAIKENSAADLEKSDEEGDFFDEDDPPPSVPAPKPSPTIIGGKTEPENYSMFAPVAHVRSQDRTILADYGYGAGRIVVLTDPYIVSNGGIEQVDNLRLATNIVTGGDNGAIVFDEYHQGYGAGGNSLLNFFAGTPLPAIAAQFALLAMFVIYTRGRRFARALPLPNPDRRSKLEYVGAMAELQRRTKAFDLALENIYGRTRRDLARFAGVDNLSTSAEVLAARVAERSKLKKDDLANLFLACEDVIHGEQTSGKTALSLVARLREIERELGFKKAARS